MLNSKAADNDAFELTFEELRNMKVSTAGKKKQKINEIPSSVIIISSKEIQTYGYTSFTEILENVSGFYNIDTYNFGRTNLGLRGYWPSENNNNIKILVNGLELTYVANNSYTFDKINIPVESIDRIEIIRGPNSILYGSNAFLGIINVITNDTKFRENTTNASLSYGSNETYNAYIGRASGGRNYEYSINLYYHKTSGIDVPYAEMVSIPGLLPVFGVEQDATTNDKFEENRYAIDFSASLDDFYIKYYFSEALNEWMYYIPSHDKGSLNKAETINILAGYRDKLDEGLELDVNLQFIANENNFDFDIYKNTYYGFLNTEIKSITAEANLFYQKSDQFSLTLGGEYVKTYGLRLNINLPNEDENHPERFTAQLFYEGTNSEDVFSIYSQSSYNITEKFELVGGFRVDFVNDYEITSREHLSENEAHTTSFYRTEFDSPLFLPKIALIYRFSDKGNVKAIAGRSINRPAPLDYAERLLFKNDDLELDNEIMTSAEIDWNYFINNDLYFSTAFYYNRIENVIMRNVTDFFHQRQYISYPMNTNSVETYGIEAVTDITLMESLKLHLTGNYMLCNYTDDFLEEVKVAYSPSVLANINLSYNYSYFTFAVFGNFISEMEPFYNTELINENDLTSFKGRIGESVSSYFDLNANLMIRGFPYEALSLNVKVGNLLDETIRYPVYVTNSWADRGTIGRGRSVFFRIQYGID